MHHHNETMRDEDARNHELAAKLTESIYPLLLRYGLKDLWLASQLNLWNLLSAAVTEWAARWRLASLAGSSEGLRNFVAADLAGRSFVVVQTTGIAGPPRPLRVAVINSFRAVLRETGRANPTAGTCGGRRRSVSNNSTEKSGSGNESRSMVHVGTLV